MKATAINDVILAVVESLSAAVSYPVFDGPPADYPNRKIDQYVSIGAENIDDQTDPTHSAQMDAEWKGLGQKLREESLSINCVAVAKSAKEPRRGGTIAEARAIAMQVMQDVQDHLPLTPSAETYNAQVSAISAVRSHNITGGAIVQIQFTISATARLI